MTGEISADILLADQQIVIVNYYDYIILKTKFLPL